MKWKVGDKFILASTNPNDGSGVWGPYEGEVIKIKGDRVHIRYKGSEWHEMESYLLKHLERYGTPLTKLHKILS